MSPSAANPAAGNNASLAAYYRWHAWVYDLTRWAFLFGRADLIRRTAAHMASPKRVLEIGCGTGMNLVALARAYSGAEITGLDLSQDMLEIARRKTRGFGTRVSLLHQAYEGPVGGAAGAFDLIVCSYSLSMMNPGFEDVLKHARADLSPRGVLAVVDFHETRWPWFQRWMAVNHVRMEGQIMDYVRQHFQPLTCQVKHGYGDLWRYLVFIGKRPGA